MTSHRRNALETVQAVRAAEQRVRAWTLAMKYAASEAKPEWLNISRSDDLMAWFTTVELFRRSSETAQVAAQRLTLYLDLHQETVGRAPDLEGVQSRAAEDHVLERCPVCAPRPREDCGTCGGLGVVL